MALKTTPIFRWDADARTIDFLSGDGAFSFSVGKAIGVVCGLNNQNNGPDYFEIDHAFYIDTDGCRVIEKGVYKTPSQPYAANAVFKIERLNQTVRYFVDNQFLYASSKPSAGVVFGDCSLYAYLDTVLDACLVDYGDEAPLALDSIESQIQDAKTLLQNNADILEVVALWSGVAEYLEILAEQNPSNTFIELLAALVAQVDYLLGLHLGAGGAGLVLDLVNVILDLIDLGDEALLADSSVGLAPVGPLAAIGIDASANIGYLGIGPLSVVSTEKEVSQGQAALGPVWAVGYDGDAAWGAVEIGPLASRGLDTPLIVPEFNLGRADLGPLGVYSYEGVLQPNTGDVGLGPVWAFGADAEVNVGLAEMGPLTASGRVRYRNFLYAEWPGWSTTLTQLLGNMAVALTVPAPILTAHAHDHDNIRFAVTVPAPILTAFTGAKASLSVPAPTLASAGTVQVFASVALEVPAPELTATASTPTGASVTLEVPAPTLTAFTGAYASLEVLAPILTATGSVGHLARVALTLPFIELTATAKVGAVATVSLSVPAPTLEASGIVGSVAHVALVLPAMILTAGDAATINETTYAVNLTTGAVTTLLLGELTRLVTAHGRLYGLRGTELVRLDGDTDGATLIPATVRFAPQTFGSNRAKRLSTVYIESREDDGLTLDVVADEQTAWRYQTNTDTARAYGTHKVKVGRGVKFHTAGLVVKNRNGGRMDIGGMELLVDTGAPRPKS